MSTAFAIPLSATVTAGGSGVNSLPLVFAGPTSDASTNPGGKSATTDVSGAVSASVTANAIAGGPYTVTVTIGGVATSTTYSLTNTTPPVATTLNKTAGDNQ